MPNLEPFKGAVARRVGTIEQRRAREESRQSAVEREPVSGRDEKANGKRTYLISTSNKTWRFGCAASGASEDEWRMRCLYDRRGQELDGLSDTQRAFRPAQRIARRIGRPNLVHGTKRIGDDAVVRSK